MGENNLDLAAKAAVECREMLCAHAALIYFSGHPLGDRDG